MITHTMSKLRRGEVVILIVVLCALLFAVWRNFFYFPLEKHLPRNPSGSVELRLFKGKSPEGGYVFEKHALAPEQYGKLREVLLQANYRWDSYAVGRLVDTVIIEDQGNKIRIRLECRDGKYGFDLHAESVHGCFFRLPEQIDWQMILKP